MQAKKRGARTILFFVRTGTFTFTVLEWLKNVPSIQIFK